MTAHPTMARLMSATALAVLLPITAAGAADLDRLSTSLKASLAAQGMTVDWTGIEGDDSEAKLNGVTLKLDGVEKPTEIGTVTLSNISEEADHFLIEEATLPDYNVTNEGVTVAATGLSISGMQVPFDAATASNTGILLYDSADLESFTVTESDKEIVKVGGLNFTMEAPQTAGEPMEFTGSTKAFAADLSTVKDPKAKAVISQMGYETISGGFDLTGSWNITDGRMIVDKYDMKIDNAGTLGMTFDLSGYTPAFIKSLRETSEKMAAASEEEQSAQGLAMLGLMQQLTFNSATIRFDDDALTTKVLDVVAKEQNTTADAVANQAKAIVPFGLAQLNMPDFATAVSAAVNKFLDDPKSIEITARPATGVPFAQIMATGMSTPQALIQQLNVAVTAND